MNFQILNNTKKKVGSLQKGVINITKGNKKSLKLLDIKTIGKHIMDDIDAKYKKKCKMIITGLGPLGRSLLKGYDDDIDQMAENEDDYLNGRVRESTKFQKFTQIEISYYY
jgi:hypothetical protein